MRTCNRVPIVTTFKHGYTGYPEQNRRANLLRRKSPEIYNLHVVS